MLKQLQVWGVKGILSWMGRQVHERCVAADLVRNARAHRNTQPVRGVTIIGAMTGGFSLSKVLRDFAFALKKAGIPFQTYDTQDGCGVKQEDYEGILTSRDEFDVNRFDHVVEMVKSPLPAGVSKARRSRIVFWEGESGLLDVYPYLAGDDVIIGMSDFNVNYFRQALPKTTPVRKILYPLPQVNPNLLPVADVRKRYGLSQDDFVVFYNFDLLAFGRKNPDGVMRAFAQAFPADRCAKLLFKVNNVKAYRARYDQLVRLANEMKVADRFKMISDYLSLDEIYSLTNACDVYCSLHRAEGFGLGIAEAMSLGKPVVVTDWSSTTEFCRPENSFPVPYRKVAIKPGEYFSPLGEWAEADIDAAAQVLRRVKDAPTLRDEVGKRAKSFIKNYFSQANFRRSVEDFLSGS